MPDETTWNVDELVRELNRRYAGERWTPVAGHHIRYFCTKEMIPCDRDRYDYYVFEKSNLEVIAETLRRHRRPRGS